MIDHEKSFSLHGESGFQHIKGGHRSKGKTVHIEVKETDACILCAASFFYQPVGDPVSERVHLVL